MGKRDAGRSGREASEQLERLLGELRYVRSVDGEKRAEHYERLLPEARARLGSVPLVHGLARTYDLISIIQQGSLQARSLRSPRKGMLDSEQVLGLSPSVYTSVGVSYPERDAALVFCTSVEDGVQVDASPWDSGHLCRSQCDVLRNASSGKRKKVFQSNILPSPQYRTYLVEYVASCFRDVVDYIDNNSHCYRDPSRVMDENCELSRIFEVRFPSTLPYPGDGLLAVPLPGNQRKTLSNNLLREHVKALRGAKVDVCYYKGARRRLRNAVRNWMRKRLNLVSGEAQ